MTSSGEPRSTRRRRGLIALGGLGAVVVVIAIAVFVVSTGSDPTIPAGAPAVATAGEFEAALTSALDTLADAPGVVGTEESRIGEHLASKVWWSARPGGDAAVIQQRDVDVADTAWWLTAEAPLRVGERIATIAWVLVDGTFLEASEAPSGSQSWTEREAPGGPMALGLGLLYPSDPPLRDLLSLEADLVRRWTEEDGTTTWELTGAMEAERWMQRFRVDPRGHLVAWETQRLSSNDDPSIDLPPIEASSITFEPLSDPEPIPLPTADTALDLSGFDLPEGFLVGQ